MGKVLETKSKRRSKAKAARIRAIVRKMPKMPSLQNRRLTFLMEESKDRRLTNGEDKELRALLDLVDRQTYWNLAKAIEIEARESANRN